jgi:hypothetical protein
MNQYNLHPEGPRVAIRGKINVDHTADLRSQKFDFV